MATSCLSKTPRLHLSNARQALPLSDSVPRTLLSFLYQTGTILRHYVTDTAPDDYRDSSSVHDAQVDWKSNSDTLGSKQTYASAERDLADRLGGQQLLSYSRSHSSGNNKLEHNGLYGGSRYSFSHNLAQSDSKKRRGRQDYVPFEEDNAEARLTGSTITESEFKAFERLFEETVQKGGFDDEEMSLDMLFGGKPRKSSHASTKELVDVVTEFDTPRGGPANNSVAVKVYPHGPTDFRYENRLKRFHELRKLIDEAKTDQELWQILHHRIFAQLKALELDNPKVNEDRERRRVAIQKKNLEMSKAYARGRRESFEEIKFEEDSLDTWAAIVPQLLVHMSKNLSERFPGSSVSLAVLPALKEQGSSEFALGASTALYNRHMRLLWERYGDLPGICRTLEEMDRAVFSFNTSTLSLVIDILSHYHMACRGQLGAGVQILWSSERKSRYRRKLFAWRAKLRNSLIQERFLKARREQRDMIEGVDELDGPQIVEEEPVFHVNQGL